MIRYEPPLEVGEFPERRVYVSEDFEDWVCDVLPNVSRDRGGLAPHEQVDELLNEFVLGRPLAYEVGRKVLDPVTNYVWELKTADVRVFGWFPKKGTFVAVCGELKKHLTKRIDYDPHIKSVVGFRDNLDLDPPKYITGVRANEVL